MSFLTVAQFMAAAAFFTVALMHLLVWLRRHAGVADLCAGLTAIAAGVNAIAEQAMYRAVSLDTMAAALKWYVATSAVWIVALIWFVVVYTRIGKVGYYVAVVLSTIFGGALVLNFFSKSSFLYTELVGLREMMLPWGETIRLVVGHDNPWRFVTEVSLLGVFGLVFAGGLSLRRQGQQKKALLFSGGITIFLVFYVTHAFLVDTGKVNSPYLSTYAFLLVVFVMSYDLSSDVVGAAELSGRLQRKEAELRTAVAVERNRIAGELHDSVTQTLFSTAAIAEALPDVWDRHPDEARRGLVELRSLTKGALAEMRSLLVELRPAALLEKSLGDLLQELANALAGRSKISVNVVIEQAPELPNEVKIALYRVAQEALNNIVKHSGASNATLGLRFVEGCIVLSIEDDGNGFDTKDSSIGELGLEIMDDRVCSIGGDLRIDSIIDQGTRVTVRWKDTSR